MQVFIKRHVKVLIVLSFTSIFLCLLLQYGICDYSVKNVYYNNVLLEPTKESKHFVRVTKSLSQLGRAANLSGHLLMFNRIPKTGSELFLLLLQELQGGNSFRHVRLRGNSNRLSKFEQREFTHNMSSIIREYAIPLTFDRNVYFTNFSEYGLQSPTHFNLIRDPIEILISSYHEKMSAKTTLMAKTNNSSMQPAISRSAAEDFIECWLDALPECSFEDDVEYNLTIPYFCGHDPKCARLNSKWALNKAKKNVDRFYPVVGILEFIYETLYVVEKRLPFFFKGANEIYLKKMSETYKKWKQKSPMKSIVKHSLRNALSLEYEFYYWIKERLLRQVSYYSSRKEEEHHNTRKNQQYSFQVEQP